MFDDIDAPAVAALLTSDDIGASTSFGTSLSLDGDALLIGSPLATVDAELGVGRAHLFRHQAIGWAHVADLMSPQTESFGSFGSDVALSGDTTVINWRRRSQGSDNPASAVAFDL